MDVKRIENLFELVKNTDIRELCWEREAVKLRIKRTNPTQALTQDFQTQNSSNVVDSNPDNMKESVTSKFVGTFVSLSTKGKKEDVKVGDRVTKGQILGYVEAMRIFKEVVSDFEGIVSEIHTKDGLPVEYGQELFAIEIK